MMGLVGRVELFALTSRLGVVASLVAVLLLGLAGVSAAAEPESAITTGAATVAGHSGESSAGEPGAAGHGEEAKAETPELPNFISVLLHSEIGGVAIKDTKVGHFMHVFEKQIIMLFVTVVLALIMFGTLHLREMIPGKLQTFLEMIVEGFYNFIISILGPRGAPYVPFLGTLFLFIFVQNLMGIVPLMAPATSMFQTTITLAIIALCYVHWVGIQQNGVLRWIDHLCGSPRDILGFVMIPLHLIGELARPLSLSLRLFGNIMGEDILIGVFLMLGISLMSAVWPHPWIGVPLHLPFFFLAMITCTIQALVFTVLTTIYLLLLLPHEDHDEEHKTH